MVEAVMYVLTEWFEGVSWVVLLAMAGVLVLLFVPKMGVVMLKWAGQAGVGSLLVMGFNWVFGGIGLFVGLNVVTVGVMGLLGLPGMVALYILSAII